MAETTVVTILFTDIVGSTELSQRLGEDGAETLRQEHTALLRDAISEAGGTEVKHMGDGVMVVFGSPSDALACAVGMQQKTERHNRRLDEPIGLRVGIHIGEVTRENEDYFGTAVVVAERLCKRAEGGQTLASEFVRGLAGTRGGFRFFEAGLLDLKGLGEPMAALDVAWEPLGAAGAPLPPELSREATVAFVGREDEFDRLRSAWKSVREGGLGLMLVAGEPGIGKTRLASELARTVHEEGATVLLGRCDELSSVPYRPFVEALGFYVNSLGSDEVQERVGPEAGRLLPLVPAIAERIQGAAPPESTDAETDRMRLLDAVTSVLAGATAANPLLLILDDLHWADAPSLQLLRHVMRASKVQRTLIVGTYRETDLGRTHPLADMLAELRRMDDVGRVHLRGFDVGAIIEWLGAAGGHEVGRRGRRLAEALHEATEGNPFFVQQIVVNLVESGRLLQRDGVWTFDVSVADLGIPEGIKEVVGRRLARLSAECNQTLGAAAVIGRDFEVDVLTRMSPLAPEAVLDALDEASGLQLIAEAEGSKRPTYTFTHALVRQTLYEELSMARRQRLHRACAEGVEAVHSSSLETVVADIARHLRAAGTGAPLDKALDFSVRAANQAASVFGWEEAIDHLESVLELVDETTEPERTARVLSRLGDMSYMSAVGVERGTEALERALSIYERLGQRERSARMHSRIGRGLSSYAWHMDIPKALGHYRDAVELMTGAEDSHALGLVYIGLAGAGIYGLAVDEGLAASARALEIAERIGDEPLRANGFALHGCLLGMAGEFDKGTAELDAAWDEAQRLSLGSVSFFATWNRQFISLMLRDYGEARRRSERELDQPYCAKVPTLRIGHINNLIGHLMGLGELDESRRYSEEYSELMASTNTSGGSTPRIRDALSLAAGEWELYEQSLDVTIEQGRRSGNTLFELSGLAGLATLAGDRGDIARALEGMDRCLAISTATGSVIHELNSLVEGALLLAEEARRDEARARLDRAHALRSGQDVKGIEAMLLVCEALLADDGAQPDRETLFGRAIDVLRRYPAPWFEANAYRLWGHAMQRAGDTPRAVERFDDAVAVYRRIGAGQPYIDRVLAERP